MHVPFLRYGYLHNWWLTRGGGEWPESRLVLITAHENGRLVGVAPLFYTPDHQGQPRLMLLGSIEVTDYLDLIVLPECLPAFIDALLPFLRQVDLPNWQNLDLYNLFENSPSLPAISQSASRLGWSLNQERVYHCPYIPIPGDWETYLASIDKKQRHEIRRKIRRLETADVPNRWYMVKDASTLDAEIDEFTALMEQDEDKARFLTPLMREFMRGVVHWAFDEGTCFTWHSWKLTVKKPPGTWHFNYLNRLWVYNSGINRAFIEYSPGWVLARVSAAMVQSNRD